MSSTPQQSPEANFLILCQRVLDSLSSMIKDGRDNGLSDVDPSQLDTTRNLLRLSTPQDLVTSFIEKKEHWKKIENKEMTFLEKGIGALFSDAGILEAHVVEEPVRIYLLLKTWKNDPSKRPLASKKSINYDKPFINDQDIETLWSRFKLMIKLSCKWNAANGNKYDLSEFNPRYL